MHLLRHKIYIMYRTPTIATKSRGSCVVYFIYHCFTCFDGQPKYSNEQKWNQKDNLFISNVRVSERLTGAVLLE